MLLDHDFALLIETIPQLVWRSRDLGEWTWASKQWTAFTGQGDPASHGLGWLRCVHPEDRDRTMDAWSKAAGTGGLDVVHRIMRSEGEGFRWFETRARPRPAPDGGTEWFGTCTDVHDLRIALDRQTTLLHELQHRVRNMLAGMRGIVRRSFDSTRSKQDFANHLEDRLTAMARVQGVATRDPFARIDMGGLIQQEFDALLAQEGSKVRIAGPDVSLSLRAAETLGIAFHELATNALKFGSLGSADSPLKVSWKVESNPDGQQGVLVEWKEFAPGTSKPRREGLGMDVILRKLPYELGARTSVQFPPDGLSCRIALPVGEDVQLSAMAGIRSGSQPLAHSA